MEHSAITGSNCFRLHSLQVVSLLHWAKLLPFTFTASCLTIALGQTASVYIHCKLSHYCTGPNCFRLHSLQVVSLLHWAKLLPFTFTASCLTIALGQTASVYIHCKLSHYWNIKRNIPVFPSYIVGKAWSLAPFLAAPFTFPMKRYVASFYSQDWLLQQIICCQ